MRAAMESDLAGAKPTIIGTHLTLVAFSCCFVPLQIIQCSMAKHDFINQIVAMQCQMHLLDHKQFADKKYKNK